MLPVTAAVNSASTPSSRNTQFPRHAPLPRSGSNGIRNANSAGFTIIEVTLAAVVVSIGLLTLFGLGQLGLRNAKTMEDDTRTAMLAEDIFASLRTVSETLCASPDATAWATFWQSFADGSTNLPLPLLLSTATSFSNQCDNLVYAGGRICTNYLWSRADIHASGIQVPEWAARYWMDIALTNQPGTSGEFDLARVTLHIAPGITGPIAEERSFYTHFANHGTLP